STMNGRGKPSRGPSRGDPGGRLASPMPCLSHPTYIAINNSPVELTFYETDAIVYNNNSIESDPR
ncbi:MAG: hypothetical protein ACRDIV_25010, partial [Ktedonobacteraceae bacterium]